MYLNLVTLRGTHILAAGPFATREEAKQWKDKYYKLMGAIRTNCVTVELASRPETPVEFVEKLDKIPENNPTYLGVRV